MSEFTLPEGWKFMGEQESYVLRFEGSIVKCWAKFPYYKNDRGEIVSWEQQPNQEEIDKLIVATKLS